MNKTLIIFFCIAAVIILASGCYMIKNYIASDCECNKAEVVTKVTATQVSMPSTPSPDQEKIKDTL